MTVLNYSTAKPVVHLTGTPHARGAKHAVGEVRKALRDLTAVLVRSGWADDHPLDDDKGLAKFEKADETIPVCIIGLQPSFASPENNIARFDFGICMAAFDGKQTIRAAEFDRDENARTFTLCRADSPAQFAYSLSRFEKITAARYAGWTLSIPSEFEELAKEHTFRRHWYWDRFSRGGFDGGESILKPKERVAAHQ